MIVAQSDMTLAVSHQSVEREEQRTTIRMWIGSERPDFEGTGASATPVSLCGEDRVTLSSGLVVEETCFVEPRLEIVRLLIEHLTGRAVNVLRLEEGTADETSGTPYEASGQEEAAETLGWGIEVDTFQSRYEAEETAFTASGVIRTADGGEIRFSLALEMSRYRYEESSTTLRLGDAARMDPLVINFGGNAADLADVRFSFDLDGDGSGESIASLGSGSGYLVIDRDGDGMATDGGELFGPRTGRGFAELAAFDDDGNGWIDGNDGIYDELKVWIGAGSGETGLTSLAGAGVGALSLANLDTPFDVKDRSNALLGSVRSTGIYVGNEGAAGTVQQIDLAV
ncbi:MAG TPA: hypothetical protein PKY58_03890 [Syntrophales bacterium]|nr:hypothetical protein [Syntrophales bacterium]HPX11033.1 hypothetical protein [Syntrophales bacterium]HQB30396.1 hypothetical protein [Syntrophales bacterium]HQN76823.1 hypothetical protein [Syntrophales bacterium]HQQ26645.1 hypothetical protein [Syntrophales bacterium]